MKTIVQLQGGLGNQLFEYVAALIASKGETDDIYSDRSYYAYVRNRHIGLDRLGLHTRALNFFSNPLEVPLSLPLIGDYWRTFYPRVGAFNLFFEEKQYLYSHRLSEMSSPVYLSGFWQHREYGDQVERKLRDLLVFPPLLPQGNSFKERIEGTQSVAVHIRRGDYLRSSSFRVCSPAYFHGAIDYMNSHLKKPHFFFFSDDITWCKEEFGSLEECTFVENLNDEVSDLYLMSVCRNHIIANSTFSWWGAWLQEKKGITIAPKNWCGNSEAAEALLYKSWIQME